jgi:hypothetical protein
MNRAAGFSLVELVITFAREHFADRPIVITDIGTGLEEAAERADTDASRQWLGELSSYLDRVETVGH